MGINDRPHNVPLTLHGRSPLFRAWYGFGILGAPSLSWTLTPGTCFNFHSGRGGGGGSPLDPLPPSPLSSSALENLSFGNIF